MSVTVSLRVFGTVTAGRVFNPDDIVYDPRMASSLLQGKSKEEQR